MNNILFEILGTGSGEETTWTQSEKEKGTMMKFLLALLILLFCFGCGNDDTGSGSDGDSNSDSDSDSDADCEEIVCDDPPDDECTDNGNLIQYTGEATCIDGECNYSYEVIECEWGCEVLDGNDQCFDPCEDVICDDPPDGYCEIHVTDELDIAFNYHENGSCFVNENDLPECEYFLNSDFCWWEPFNGHCEVIDGSAECVED